jgi:hypothetical protein
MALAAVDHRCIQQRAARRTPQPGKTVITYSYYG